MDIWNSAKKKQLTYCVSNAFGARKPTVVADMTAATGAWEEAADVDFIHVAAQDANCTASNQNVLFDVGRSTWTANTSRARSSPATSAPIATC